MKVVVIGGTGLIGSKVVRRLEVHGHKAVAAAPNTGVNSLTGEGLDEVLTGASVVIDLSNSPSFEDQAVLDFFRTATSNVLAAEKKAGVGHHVALSIVGTERSPQIGYFRAKIAQEELIEASGIPFSLVHATQFFEFVKAIADTSVVDGVVRIQPVDFQPIAGDDVADQVAKVAVGEPLNARVDIAGPDKSRMDEFFRKALAELNDPREVVTDPEAQYYGAVVSEDALVPTGDAVLGRIHYADWVKQ
ncbi:SDR family oxidoreductase [Kribbella antibiotica]|uniref:SDR family oxidoreductase n=1 Tax=Kribbella antibiotica TaxID=190195 RepID=A0A4R4YXT6_9ACTN|nr:SDR family oxidoreductase [Kribbella antibiotica]TDD49780.1 SDR family oxidoreductase [Kribbella antibiotica]